MSSLGEMLGFLQAKVSVLQGLAANLDGDAVHAITAQLMQTVGEVTKTAFS